MRIRFGIEIGVSQAIARDLKHTKVCAATQPPPTKHLTDEELKQQYGIHMTSRIQEDGNATESKWADIDDDEDDWAPETIEWNDGTKIKLTHTEHAPAPSQESANISDGKENVEPVRSVVEQNTKISFLKSSTTVGPNATVLRLGANAERHQLQQQSKVPFSSKSGTDKPILTTKPSAPVPTKSPWAALPPVEKGLPSQSSNSDKSGSSLKPLSDQRADCAGEECRINART